MLTRKQKGDLGELRAITALYEQGYEIFLPMFDNGETDIVVAAHYKLYRVSVKFTSAKTRNNKWRVALATTYKGTDGKSVTKYFDANKYDLLAVYIQPEDRVVIVPTAGMRNKTQLNIDLEDETGRVPVPHC